MAMHRCDDCGHIFEEGEQARWTEPHGENMSGCPLCKGSYAEANSCKICGSYDCDYGEEFCEECKIDVQKRYMALMAQFDENEKEIIRELII